MAKPLDVISKPVAFGARQAINLTQLAIKGGTSAVSAITGGDEQSPPADPPRQEQQTAPRRRSSSQPKPLDDVSITRKVETRIFRDSKVPKGKIDVNTANGVVWLRGEAKTPEMVKSLEAQASSVPEVTRVENLLHLPKTPAPTRTDTPAAQRKTRSTKSSPSRRKVTPRRVSAERSTASAVAEPKPKDLAGQKRGRQPAPLGSAETTAAAAKPAAAKQEATKPKAAPAKPKAAAAQPKAAPAQPKAAPAKPKAAAATSAPAPAATAAKPGAESAQAAPVAGNADGPSGPVKVDGAGPAGAGATKASAKKPAAAKKPDATKKPDAAKKPAAAKQPASETAEGPSGPVKVAGSGPAGTGAAAAESGEAVKDAAGVTSSSNGKPENQE